MKAIRRVSRAYDKYPSIILAKRFKLNRKGRGVEEPFYSSIKVAQREYIKEMWNESLNDKLIEQKFLTQRIRRFRENFPNVRPMGEKGDSIDFPSLFPFQTSSLLGDC